MNTGPGSHQGSSGIDLGEHGIGEATLPERFRATVIVFVALFGLVFAFLLVVTVGSYFQNTSRFNEWKAELLEYPVPAGATLVDAGSEFGLLWGYGSHCDGRVWVIFEGDMGKDAIEQHYGEITNTVVKRESRQAGTWRVSVLRTHLGPAGLDLRCH